MRKILFALILVVPLAGCTTFQKLTNAYQTVTSAKLDPKDVYVARESFDVIEATATRYLTLCTKQPTTFGCSQAAINAIVPSVRSGRNARNRLVVFMKAHPDGLGAQGLYDALVSSTALINDVAAQYNIKGVTQ